VRQRRQDAVGIAGGLRRNPLEFWCDGWGSQGLSRRSFPLHVMPGVAFPPVGPLGLGAPPSPGLCAAKTPPCPSRVASLVARFPIPCLLHCVRVVPRGLVAWWKPPGHARAFGRPVPQSGHGARRQVVLPRSRATPLKTCPALRPRWCPAHLPLSHTGLLPSGACTPSALTSRPLRLAF